jgi:hypothetical protein
MACIVERDYDDELAGDEHLPKVLVTDCLVFLSSYFLHYFFNDVVYMLKNKITIL